MNALDTDDPKGLIRESYLIAGIGADECRSILIDWALSLPLGQDSRAALARLVDRHAHAAPDHPMTALLREGLQDIPAPTGRRGGTAGRRKPVL